LFVSVVYVCCVAGPDNLANLKKIAEQYQRRETTTIPEGDGEDDDDVPELVEGETFEEAAKKDGNP
jgi:nascent polypeptide-associated complex subunit beta